MMMVPFFGYFFPFYNDVIRNLYHGTLSIIKVIDLRNYKKIQFYILVDGRTGTLLLEKRYATNKKTRMTTSISSKAFEKAES